MTYHGSWPSVERTTYPTRWVLWYGWRRFVFFTPKIRLRSLMVTVTPLPFRWQKAVWLGLWVGRDEDDDELSLRLGLGLIEVDANVMVWTS